jgi:alanine racemase
MLDKEAVNVERHLNTAKIDTGALIHNLGEARRLVGPKVRIMAVVKADAYGHGVVSVGRTFAENGADALGVMDLHEAALLRDAGLRPPIFILAGVTPDQLAEIAARQLTPFIYDPALARELDRVAAEQNRIVEVHLKVDTGMNRLGVRHDQADPFFEAVADLPNIVVAGLATHFSDADLKDSAFIQKQIERFDDLIVRAKKAGLTNLSLNNAANSAAVMSLDTAHFDMVRPGLMLYGDYPADHLRGRADLKPAMSVESRVIQVKTIPQGAAVSYGRTWKAEKETTIATVPIGYTHGYDRLLSNQGQALIRGRAAPVRGRVCMNLTMFDVTHIPDAAVGDEVVLLGRQGDAVITGQDIADRIGTIGYEVFCVMGGLNHRRYV